MTMKTKLTMNHRKVRQKRSGVPMNQPTPDPSQESAAGRTSNIQHPTSNIQLPIRLFPSWEGLGVACFLTKFSQAARSFGARNLFRLNACWSRGPQWLQPLCAVRGVMRTEVRAPLGSGCAPRKSQRAFSLIEMLG